MKVNRLIQILKTFQQDDDVVVRSNSGTFWKPNIDVRESKRMGAVALDGCQTDRVNSLDYKEWLIGDA